jgi:hypothetical protein
MDWLLKRMSPDKLLKFVPIEKIIDVLTDWLGSTVKNPRSEDAARLFRAVAKLRSTCDDFLRKAYNEQ